MFKKPKHETSIGGPDAPAAVPTLRDRLPYTTVEMPAVARSNPWPELPLSNRFFLAGAGIFAAWLVLRMGGPPAANAAHDTVFPYTSTGKRETCLSNLRALQAALAMYSQDSAGMLPPLESKDGAGNRATWVTLTRHYAGDGSFVCPTGPSVRTGTNMVSCAYAMNPVLAGTKASAVDDPSKALLMADAGTRHDVSLLPALPTWPSFKSRSLSVPAVADTNSPPPDPEAENLSFRHDNSASALYADGHADTVYRDSGWDSLTPWGGSAASRLSLTRIGGQSADAGKFVALLKSGDAAAAAGLYAGHRRTLSGTADNILQLWLESGGSSDSVETAGWNLAQAKAMIRDQSAQSVMDAELARRCKLELDAANNAGSEPKAACTELSIPIPRNWAAEDASDSSHPRTRFRSGLKDLSVLVEMGHRDTYSEPGPIQWAGMEREVRRTPGAGYRRIQMGTGTLVGMPASVWEFEVNRPGGPRLRKIYYGTAGSWDTYVVVCTAPAVGFNEWCLRLSEIATELRLSS